MINNICDNSVKLLVNIHLVISHDYIYLYKIHIFTLNLWMVHFGKEKSIFTESF